MTGKENRKSLESLLDGARRRIEVTPEELKEARKRRAALGAALLKEFPGSRVYVNGSVAHGDALTPLTDVDVGMVVAGAEDTHGPGLRGPLGLMEQAADAIRRELKEEYGDLYAQVNDRKRSILVRFRDPVTPGQDDFTADVIVAVDNTKAAGLYIPKVPSWDRSHPEEHTRLVLEAIEQTEVAFARIVRLLKHWNRRHDKPLVSWNIKALALGCLLTPTTLLDGLLTWFKYAEEELTLGETEDPAGVADKPIKMNKSKQEVLRALATAREHLERAVELEAGGYDALAHQELAKVFNDESMLPGPGKLAVDADMARLAREKHAEKGTPGRLSTVPGLGLGLGAVKPPIPVRSWAP
jgi:hypothetical protein